MVTATEQGANTTSVSERQWYWSWKSCWLANPTQLLAKRISNLATISFVEVPEAVFKLVKLNNQE